MFEALGVEVIRLILSDFGPIGLDETKEGRWRALSKVEIDKLFTVLKLNR